MVVRTTCSVVWAIGQPSNKQTNKQTNKPGCSGGTERSRAVPARQSCMTSRSVDYLAESQNTEATSSCSGEGSGGEGGREGGREGRRERSARKRYQCTHPVTHSPGHSLTRSLTRSLTHSLTHLPGLCEFAGVSDDVVEDLTQPVLVAEHEG